MASLRMINYQKIVLCIEIHDTMFEVSIDNSSEIQRPQPGEYGPFFQGYIDLVPAGALNVILEHNTNDIINTFEGLTEDRHDHAYAPGKWTTKQMLMHIIDSERVMAYRLFVILRRDVTTVLSSFDENNYADNADVTKRKMNDLVSEFKAVRCNSIKLLEGVSAQASIYQGKIAGYDTSIRALGYIIIGHAMHHLSVLKERYL